MKQVRKWLILGIWEVCPNQAMNVVTRAISVKVSVAKLFFSQFSEFVLVKGWCVYICNRSSYKHMLIEINYT